jgi:hypothetical protein
VVGGALLAATVLAPLVLRKGAWLDAEAVLVLWFAIWTGAMWWLGYHGRRVHRDWPDYEPLWDLDGKRGSSGWAVLGSFDWSAADLGEGCLGILVVFSVAVVLAVLVGWLVPLLAVALFTVMRALLNQASVRAHRVRGRLLASLAMAAGWAAVYTVPLAIAVWALHALG